jgi:hypothetical protein
MHEKRACEGKGRGDPKNSDVKPSNAGNFRKVFSQGRYMEGHHDGEVFNLWLVGCLNPEEKIPVETAPNRNMIFS